MISARSLAYQILLHLDQKASHPDRLLHGVLTRHSGMDERDRALLTELVYGVLRWQLRLDWHIDQLSRIKPKKIAPTLRILLRLALYQIFFLERIPPHAAVNETVKIVKATHPSHLAGFANGLLREAIRRGGDWNWPSWEQDPIEHLAIMTSHPQWLVRRFIQELGPEETRDLCRANNSIASTVLRVNPLKGNLSEVALWLTEVGIQVESSPFLPLSLRLSGLRQSVSRLAIFGDGRVQVQDEASQMIAMIVSPKPGHRVLDLCAGFGGKSTHLGILVENQGSVLSVDHSAWKLEELKENAGRQGVQCIEVLAADILELSPDRLGEFDSVLLDAPCTGAGSIRRNPDIKWRRHPKDPFRFGRLQQNLLHHASQFVRKGGALVYATCTLFSEEDEAVARQFTEDHAEWGELQSATSFLPESCHSMAEGPFFKSWPHRHGIDGFFAARWMRRN
jgi:16S rRNA (cytosine967-C5)-methyltransferase